MTALHADGTPHRPGRLAPGAAASSRVGLGRLDRLPRLASLGSGRAVRDRRTPFPPGAFSLTISAVGERSGTALRVAAELDVPLTP